MTAARPIQEENLAGTSAPLPGPDEPNPGAADPDLALVQAASAGDHHSFEELVKRHQNRVYTRIRFMVRDPGVAEDLAQEAFLKAYLGLRSFRGDSRFSTWLNRISVNVTLHHFEKNQAQKRRSGTISLSAMGGDVGGDLEIEDRSQLPQEWAIENERQSLVIQAVAELAPEYRLALSMRDLYGHSYMEISETLDMPIGTVKSKIFRARQLLKEKLKGVL